MANSQQMQILVRTFLQVSLIGSEMLQSKAILEYQELSKIIKIFFSQTWSQGRQQQNHQILPPVRKFRQSSYRPWLQVWEKKIFIIFDNS
jgi:hypothetical protein